MARVFLMVLDSCGAGAAPDARAYGDEGANTLGHVLQAVPGLQLPHMMEMGLGRILGLDSGGEVGAYGLANPVASGKDTTTGHWEMACLPMEQPFPTYPQGFPPWFVEAFQEKTGRKVLCNRPASGTQVIQDFGVEHMASGAWILYTSADSVCQIAAHTGVIPLEELYRACRIARDLLQGEDGVGRIIARPFQGEPGAFVRTADRHDFSLEPPGETLLDRLQARGVPTYGIGKIGDIFCGRGLDHTVPTRGNAHGLQLTLEHMERVEAGAFVFINLVDFDSHYGHRNDAAGYGRALEEVDRALGPMRAALGPQDVLILTADHGCDPTHPGTDHTRERAPILAWSPGMGRGVDLGIRPTFSDIGSTVLDLLGQSPLPWGQSFAAQMKEAIL